MFKFSVPDGDTTVKDFQTEHSLKPATARYHLEKMVKAGALKKEILGFFKDRPSGIYNPMHTHILVWRAIYSPV